MRGNLSKTALFHFQFDEIARMAKHVSVRVYNKAFMAAGELFSFSV